MTAPKETCENCGRTIGKLETPWLYDDNVVCRECWERLQEETAEPTKVAPPAPARPAYVPLPQPVIAGQKVQTVEQTGKVWKLQMILAFLVCMFGIAIFIAGISGGLDWKPADERQPDPAFVGLGCVGLTVGLIWFVIVRVFAWWHHG